MKRLAIIAVTLAALALVVAWISRNTYWEDAKVPVPMRGEAAVYPMYAAEVFARRLGARVTRLAQFEPPSADAVVYLSNWNWDLGDARRLAIQHWVESGGRLVIEDSVYFPGDTFTAWSGIDLHYESAASDGEEDEDEPGDCITLQQVSSTSPLAQEANDRRYSLCTDYPDAFVSSTRVPTWMLRNAHGTHALRVTIGKGSVSIIRAEPTAWRGLFEGDHLDLFVALTQLRGGDELVFLSEGRHPSLLQLTWRSGWPVVLAGLLALLLALWRDAIRFGPLQANPQPLRRSLAEQIRGTGLFALRHRDGTALLMATRRALDAAASQVIPGYAALAAPARLDAVASRTGLDAAALHAAMQAVAQRPAAIRQAIAQLELARRRILLLNPGRNHGSRN